MFFNFYIFISSIVAGLLLYPIDSDPFFWVYFGMFISATVNIFRSFKVPNPGSGQGLRVMSGIVYVLIAPMLVLYYVIHFLEE